MFEVPPLCENESDDAPNGSYDLISSFGTYTNQKPHRVSLKKLGWINGVNPLTISASSGFYIVLLLDGLTKQRHDLVTTSSIFRR